VGCAIHAACRSVQQELLRLAKKMAGSPLGRARLDDLIFADGKIRHRDDSSMEVSVADAMRAGKADRIEKEATVEPKEDGKRSHYTHSAVFAEVRIDEQLGRQPDYRRRGRRHRHGAA
jgi:xanthine dehydrogenase YagR molybdenum-binding subunit